MTAERAFARMISAAMQVGSALRDWHRCEVENETRHYVAVFGSGEYIGAVWWNSEKQEYCWILEGADEPLEGEGTDWEEGP